MSHYSEDSFLPVQHILFALSKARNLLTAEMDVALAGTGVSSSHVGELLLLALGDARSSAELSRLLGINSGFVTRVVDRLERRGLVRRGRNSPDRRVVDLTLTEAGRHVAGRIAEIMPAVLNRRLSGFTPLEFATLCRLLGKLLDE
ncbi:MarR family transcriptional regulator [Paraburkholderia panacisoli]|uniref:MarR family transcriptional regulator n=1 Tax=Paraburkholderia panacisoli TaxID=2603818 RepID=A0A5B0GMN2_9BURK|nr:MarR family transcriptional regulator [Paraburkholderia panacisoli]KAA1003688.1 MarR family transcriptional regulator [Paraburkholderia panacisoli]